MYGKERVERERERENNFSLVFRDPPFAYPWHVWCNPLSRFLQARTLGLSRNNHDPRADSVPYFQQLIRLSPPLPVHVDVETFVSLRYTLRWITPRTGYRYSSLNVYSVPKLRECEVIPPQIFASCSFEKNFESKSLRYIQEIQNFLILIRILRL